MSGYQQVPGYNPEYPQPGYQQPGYQQPGYPQPGYPQYQQTPPAYPQQPAYGQPAYPAYSQPQGPITVNLVNNQNQTAMPATQTVFLGRNYDSDVAPALIIFIVGWFCCCVWLAGFRFIRSPNGAARGLGIASVVMFFAGIIIIVISVSVSATANTSNNGGSTSYKGTTSSYVYAYSQWGSLVYLPSGSSNVYISSATNSWTGYYYSYSTTSYGYSATCSSQGNGYDCPSSSNNYMRLMARCGSYGSVYSAASGSTLYCNGGQYLYLGPNAPFDNYLSSNTGYLYVTVTYS